jgi:hypothetical protein
MPLLSIDHRLDVMGRRVTLDPMDALRKVFD